MNKDVENQLPNAQRVLLSAYKSKFGISVSHIVQLKNISSYSAAYQLAMRLKKKGLLAKVEDKFFITEAGIEKLRSDKGGK